ncbi:MAG: F0F1 ATP synthase subunit gamma [Nitratireductor sp.]|jgi:F-type H+-transporting ATPase subunit gamma|nr:F0F1 ATP synthase subunit gamma [Nitratireductor sp.]
MPSLKDLKVRIASVKATQKITKAMQMVAAAKLRRAQEKAEAARPYSERMAAVLANVAQNVSGEEAPVLMKGTGRDDAHLIVVCTSDRGLCGGFNTNIVRLARDHVRKLLAAGKTVRIMTVGRKGNDQLRREFGKYIVERVELRDVKEIRFENAQDIARRIMARFEAAEVDVCTLFYARFRSVISQIPTAQQLIPATSDEPVAATQAAYEYEPEVSTLLDDLIPRNITVQIFRALLENVAGEMGAKMSAMDNATRNAGEMINKLTLSYNRQRQAQITKELIEIISGAEAL